MRLERGIHLVAERDLARLPDSGVPTRPLTTFCRTVITPLLDESVADMIGFAEAAGAPAHGMRA